MARSSLGVPRLVNGPPWSPRHAPVPRTFVVHSTSAWTLLPWAPICPRQLGWSRVAVFDHCKVNGYVSGLVLHCEIDVTIENENEYLSMRHTHSNLSPSTKYGWNTTTRSYVSRWQCDCFDKICEYDWTGGTRHGNIIGYPADAVSGMGHNQVQYVACPVGAVTGERTNNRLNVSWDCIISPGTNSGGQNKTIGDQCSSTKVSDGIPGNCLRVAGWPPLIRSSPSIWAAKAPAMSTIKQKKLQHFRRDGNGPTDFAVEIACNFIPSKQDLPYARPHSLDKNSILYLMISICGVGLSYVQYLPS